MDYRIVDADSHVNEPADVWRPRVHRVNTSCGGVDETRYTSDGVRWDEVRPGSYDPKARVDDMLAKWCRIADRGDRGFVISGYPSGEAVPTETDDRFWSEVEE